MTTIEEIEIELKKFVDIHPLAKEWLHNDIFKIKIATSYDDWIEDHEDQQDAFGTLEGHVEFCLIHPTIITGE